MGAVSSQRYLGRRIARELWTGADAGATYVQTLSAVRFGLGSGEGYSDPTFAALYPNCATVFGFHDAEATGTPPAGLRYDVIGWYADPAQAPRRP